MGPDSLRHDPQIHQPRISSQRHVSQCMPQPNKSQICESSRPWSLCEDLWVTGNDPSGNRLHVQSGCEWLKLGCWRFRYQVSRFWAFCMVQLPRFESNHIKVRRDSRVGWNRGNTNRIRRISPDEFFFLKDCFVLLKYMCLFPCSRIMCAPRKAIAKINDP